MDTGTSSAWRACILICFWMSLHLNVFWHATDYVLFMGLSHVFSGSVHVFTQDIIFDRYSPCGHSLTASRLLGEKKVNTSLVGTLEQRLSLVCWQWWIFSCWWSSHNFETTCILFCWFYMFAFKNVSPKFFICVEFLITAASCTKDFLRV